MNSNIDGIGVSFVQRKIPQFVIILRTINILIFLMLFPLAIITTSNDQYTYLFQFFGLIFLVNILGEIFYLLPISSPWAFRLAYFFGVIVSLILYIFNRPTGDAGILSIFFNLLGALIGGVMATSFRWGLYENYSPSPEIIADVNKRHGYIKQSLIRITPLKRLIDIIASLLGLIITSPIWLFEIWLIWLEDPGPVLFVKNSTGLGGKNIKLYKFRTMVRESGKAIGPYYVKKGDSRVLRAGRVFRKTALDELPQLLNILGGDISFVGPRPHRTVVVQEYLLSIPEFAERHRVKPGLAGLAQVVGGNNLTPHQKLRLDRIYINHSSISFDLKLLALAFLVVFYLRWKNNWNGRIPRNWMRFRSDMRKT